MAVNALNYVQEVATAVDSFGYSNICDVNGQKVIPVYGDSAGPTVLPAGVVVYLPKRYAIGTPIESIVSDIEAASIHGG